MPSFKVKGREISLTVRVLILNKKKEGMTIAHIAEMLKVAQPTVHYILQKYQETVSLENHSRCGRPRKTTLRVDRQIMSSTEIAQDME
jgi:transposase